MSPAPSSMRCWRAAAASLLIGLGAGSLPNVAMATCGDYLLTASGKGMGASGIGVSHAAPAHQVERSRSTSPCRQPHCRRSAPPASPVTPFVIERMSDDWASTGKLHESRPPLLSWRLGTPSTLVGSDRHPDRVERPPRVVG